jgi:histidinol-phosphate aminotransferase
MTSDPRSLLRPDLPRPSGFTVSEIPHRAKLDQNESAAALPEEVREEILEELRRIAWNRYPQPSHYAAVKERFAAAVGVRPERLLLTVGGDQMILLAFQAAGGAGRRARIFEPTYPMYAHYALVTETELDRVVLGPDGILDAAHLDAPVDLFALVSPNNPTGAALDRATAARALARQRLVLLDEAYADYAAQTLADLGDANPNLLVARSLSKAFLAGVRLGYGIGHPRIVEVLERLLFVPYHLSALQLAVAARFDRVRPHLEGWVRTVVAERERVRAGILALGLRAWPSQANFVLFESPDPRRAYETLLAHGVRIRDVSALPGLGRHLRVTVGSPEENDLFLEALRRAG